MTLALIAIIVFIFLNLSSIVRKAKRLQDLEKSRRGNRAVEQKERELWSKKLFKEYCELTKQNLPFPKLEKTRYWRDFTGAAYQDKAALESLRARHGLPSDDDLKHTVYDRSFGKETNYGNLQRIVWFCVWRAVTRRGYILNGVDFDEIKKLRLKNKRVYIKYPWMDNENLQDNK